MPPGRVQPVNFPAVTVGLEEQSKDPEPESMVMPSTVAPSALEMVKVGDAVEAIVYDSVSAVTAGATTVKAADCVTGPTTDPESVTVRAY